MTPINWDDARNVYEDMVSVLLSNIYPHAERIDGSGGDGGRDVQLRSTDRLDLFELKRFTGRLGNEKSRRNQVENSLQKAAELQPDSWALVVPIDPTPHELKWFDRLRAQYPFPLYWLGKDWLDRKMAKYVRVRRYFLEDGANEAIRVLREIAAERSGVGNDIRSIFSRVELLASQLEELEPYYRADITVTENLSSIEVVPRYNGAERDRPIFLAGRVVLPSTSVGREIAEQLRNSVRYGDEATIPGEFTSELGLNDDIFGLSELIAGSSVTIGAMELENVRFQGRLLLRSPDGISLASLPVLFSRRRKGQAGARLFGADATGSVQIELRLDLNDGKANIGLEYRQKSDLLPGALLTVLRFVSHLAVPNQFALQLGSDLIGEWRPVTVESSPVAAEYLDLIKKLDFVQRESETPFMVPDQFTSQDVHEIDEAARFFSNEKVHIQSDEISSSIHMRSLNQWEDWILQGAPMQVLFVAPAHEFRIAGVDVPAGPAYVYAAPARVANGDEVLSKRPWVEDRAVEVRIRVEEGGSLYVHRTNSGQAAVAEGTD